MTDLSPTPTGAEALEQAYRLVKSHRFVDLTHSFAPDIPHYEGFPNESSKDLYTVAANGFRAQIFTHIGQWGTHIDPPCHFHDGLRALDELDPQEFFLRLVVIDVHRSVELDPDYVVTMNDVRAWESRNGPIPEGAFVALRTDWSKRWPDATAMANRDADGVAHYPGWGREALVYLFEQRDVTAIGHETTDTDPGMATSKGDFSLESYVLGRDRYQIEMMANLYEVPEAGALIIVSSPKPKNGSGFPARLFAIVP